MGAEILLQGHIDGRWKDMATVALRSEPSHGIAAATSFGYTTDHAIEYLGRRDAMAAAWGLPVKLDTVRSSRWPAFLVDLLPQGYGRAELLRQLGLSETAGADADWQLLTYGAGNPIGHLRVAEAHDWLERVAPVHADRGFTFDDVATRGDDFTEYLASRGLFVAGSSGVQGEWPKVLLTEGRDGLLHLDHALPDRDAARHWIVKFGRGTNEALARILRLEPVYMRLAEFLGLRVHGTITLRERALFIPRFDRGLVNDGVIRYAQESLASLCGIAEFGPATTHNAAIAKLAQATTVPDEEVTEYLMRDIANVVLGNRDNHARNTAIQRTEEGLVRLTPLFDFAPMLLHPDGISRRMRWERDDAGTPRWASVAAQCREATELALPSLSARMREIGERIAALPERAIEEGVDKDLVERLRPTMRDAADQLRSI